MSQSNFLICYDYINNNSYIYLSDGSRIIIVWSCSNAVKTHNFSYFHKNFGNWKTSCQNFNKIYNNLDVNDEEEMEPINTELTDQKQILIIVKMLLNLVDQVDKKTKILLWLTSLRSCKSKLMRQIFKKVTEWLFDDCSIAPNEKKIKKIFLDLFSNTKILNIKFCSMIFPKTKILQNLQGTGQRQIRYIDIIIYSFM